MKQFLLFFAFVSLFSHTAFPARNHFSVATLWLKILQDTTHTADSVNIGYHYINRNQLTGAITTINQKQLQQVAITSVDQVLKGRVAGVQVTQNSGMPGAAASVRVRGVSTLYHSAEPLYVIDGVPINQTLSSDANQFLPILSFINPNDIAIIEVLKDAGATAIYGNRASNGVVLITTRRGQAKLNQVTFDTYFGVQEVPRQIPLLYATEYAGLLNEALQQQGQAPKYSPAEIRAFGKGTNWQDEIFRVVPVQNHQLNYAGGSVAHRIFAGAGYLNQQGVVLQSGLQRYSFRLNYDGQIGKKLKVGTSSFVTRIQNQPTQPNIISYAFLAAPTVKTDEYLEGYINPLLILKETTRSEEGKLLWNNLFVEYNIVPSLFLKVNHGITNVNQESLSQYFSNLSGNIHRTYKSYVNKITLWEGTLRYQKTWRQHSLSLLSGYNWQRKKSKITNETSLSENGQAFRVRSTDWARTEHKWMSYFGQLQYSFANKYSLSAAVRKDGSPFFSPQQRYTLSPAVAASWQVISRNQPELLVQRLKFRTSYGQTAHAYTTLTINDFGTEFLVNTGLKQEITKLVNFGTDIMFLSDRIQLSADIYQRKTSDGLVLIPIPTSNGPSYYSNNIASLRNRGLEISINTINFKGPFTWKTSFLFATNQNRVTDLSSEKRLSYLGNHINFIIEGNPATAFYGYKTDGLYQNQNELPDNYIASLGDVKYQDLNHNGDLTDDRTFIGNGQPAFIYNLDNDFSFNNFEVNFFLQGVQGNEIYNANRIELDNFYVKGPDNADNGSHDLLHYWSPSRTNTNIPRLNGSYNTYPSDRYVENGSFLRVRNLTLAYNLLQKLTLGNKMLQAKVYVSGQNLFTFTKYSGYDPELSGRLPVEQGFDEYNHPIPRTYLAGLKITW